MRISFITKSEDGIIKIPKRFKGLNAKRLKVQIELKELEKSNSKINSVKGSLSGYKNKNLIKKEKEAWKIAVKEKYENS